MAFMSSIIADRRFLGSSIVGCTDCATELLTEALSSVVLVYAEIVLILAARPRWSHGCSCASPAADKSSHRPDAASLIRAAAELCKSATQDCPVAGKPAAARNLHRGMRQFFLRKAAPVLPVAAPSGCKSCQKPQVCEPVSRLRPDLAEVRVCTLFVYMDTHEHSITHYTLLGTSKPEARAVAACTCKLVISRLFLMRLPALWTLLDATAGACEKPPGTLRVPTLKLPLSGLQAPDRGSLSSPRLSSPRCTNGASSPRLSSPRGMNGGLAVSGSSENCRGFSASAASSVRRARTPPSVCLMGGLRSDYGSSPRGRTREEAFAAEGMEEIALAASEGGPHSELSSLSRVRRGCSLPPGCLRADHPAIGDASAETQQQATQLWVDCQALRLERSELLQILERTCRRCKVAPRPTEASGVAESGGRALSGRGAGQTDLHELLEALCQAHVAAVAPASTDNELLQVGAPGERPAAWDPEVEELQLQVKELQLRLQESSPESRPAAVKTVLADLLSDLILPVWPIFRIAPGIFQ
ncbi:unnamed protein product [Polarella glacialis]|uniref:Uncharacterized protein n=1 Tax=Polarella glacialis TaxID=89957 RepID=A0A813KUE0_POLGL|nr:unnamed protein product [Polarella glacialis]